MMNERRSVVRKACNFIARYRVLDSQAVNTARLGDFSSTGASIVSSQNISRGTSVALSFSLPGEDSPIVLTGIVKWLYRLRVSWPGYRHGIEFVDLDDTSRFRLQAYIERTLKRPAAAFWKKSKDVSPSSNSWTIFTIALIVFLIAWIVSLQILSLELKAQLSNQSSSVKGLQLQQKMLVQRLEAARQRLSASSAIMSKLELDRHDLAREMGFLSSDLRRARESYENLRSERETLQARISEMELEQLRIKESLASIPLLREKLKEAITTQKEAEKNIRISQIRDFQNQELEQLKAGNKGYILWQGKPANLGGPLTIKVYSPEEKLSSDSF